MMGRIISAKDMGHTLALLALTIIVGCGESNPPVVKVESDDREMQKATEDARQSVEHFIAALQNPKPSQTYLGIKATFVEGDVVEFMWLSDVTYDGDIFVGTVANNPQDLKKVKLMDRHEVSPSDIQDWMIVDDGRLLGGYSMRVLAERMSDDERAAMEKQMGFTID